MYLCSSGGEESDPNSPTGSRTVNRVTKYDCEHKQWSTGPSMLLARRWAGAIVVDDSIYVIGKLKNYIYLATQETDRIPCLIYIG